MTKMRPEEYTHGGSDGEMQLFQKFQAATKCDDWIVFHSLDIFHFMKKSQGEADFVVLAPGLGILVIEVKASTSVEIKSGTWYLGREKDTRGPIKQASNASHALIDYLSKRGVSLNDVPVIFCAWFTKVNLLPKPQSTKWQDWMILNAEDLVPEIATTITKTFKSGHEWLKEGGVHKRTPYASAQKMSEIAAILVPNTKAVQTKENRLLQLQGWLDKALESQIQLVDVIMGEDYNAHLIEGLAGTGKTHIAVHQAKKAAANGERVLFLCYNNLLSKVLGDVFAEFPQIEVSTISKYMCKIADVKAEINASSKWWSEELPKLALEALVNKPELEKYDRVVIDEGQDLASEAYLDVVDLSLDGGLEEGHITVFADFDYQDLYVDGKIGRDLIRKKIPKIQTHGKLAINCRNTLQTGNYVTYMIGQPDAYTDYRRTDKGKDPSPIPFFPESSPSALLQNALDNLLLSYSPQEIVVLSSSLQQLKKFMENTKVSHSPLSNDRPGTVRWGTSLEFKGLESPAVIFIEFDEGAKSSRASFYVAGTRATSELVTILNPQAIGSIRESINE